MQGVLGCSVCKPISYGKSRIMSELTRQDRAALARIVTNMLDEWGIKASDQVSLLALPDGTPTRMLRRYQDDTPLPDDPDVLKRVEHLMGIADALRTTFPRNNQIGLLWLKQPCRAWVSRCSRTSSLKRVWLTVGW